MNKIFILGILIVLFLFVQQVSAECNATVWGKIDFLGCNDSAAINATIQIISGMYLLSTQTDENGFYNVSISFPSPSKNITIRIIKQNKNLKEYDNIVINCGDNISINYSIGKEPIQSFRGNIINENGDNINETDKEEVRIHLKLILEDSKNVNASESITSTMTSNGSSFYWITPNSFYCSWPTKLYLWAEPTENYYYRVFDDENLVPLSSPNYTSLIGCSLSHLPITKDFVRLQRKSVGDNCSYNDECRSNLCDQSFRICQCAGNADCADNQICDNVTHQCKNLTCLGNQRAFNHTCIDCSSYDFDNNNITDIFDAVYLLEYISGEKKDISPGCADVDNNGIVDLFDVAYILYYLVVF